MVFLLMHLLLHLHNYLQTTIENKEVELEYLPTESMLADMMTKSLGKVAHHRFVAKLLTK